MKYVRNISEVPSGEHWAILEGTSVTIPGDERSRTHPGHGYPESTESFVRYIAFTEEEEFKKELTKHLESSLKYGRPVIGIHIAGTISGKTRVELVENKA